MNEKGKKRMKTSMDGVHPWATLRQLGWIDRGRPYPVPYMNMHWAAFHGLPGLFYKHVHDQMSRNNHKRRCQSIKDWSQTESGLWKTQANKEIREKSALLNVTNSEEQETKVMKLKKIAEVAIIEPHGNLN